MHYFQGSREHRPPLGGLIRRREVKCSGENAKLVRITCAFSGHSCNKHFKILMGRFVNTDV